MRAPNQHSFFNPTSGSILTKVALWPANVTYSLGYQNSSKYDLLDPTWWDDMDWFLNPSKNKTHPPVSKILPSRRYWGWNSRYPSTYAWYTMTVPSNEWPAHLYGTLPKAWGKSATTNRSTLPNLRIM
jgi:hypothetical protein